VGGRGAYRQVQGGRASVCLARGKCVRGQPDASSSMAVRATYAHAQRAPVNGVMMSGPRDVLNGERVSQWRATWRVVGDREREHARHLLSVGVEVVDVLVTRDEDDLEELALRTQTLVRPGELGCGGRAWWAPAGTKVEPDHLTRAHRAQSTRVRVSRQRHEQTGRHHARGHSRG
jgi:hypothetical protein